MQSLRFYAFRFSGLWFDQIFPWIFRLQWLIDAKRIIIITTIYEITWTYHWSILHWNQNQIVWVHIILTVAFSTPKATMPWPSGNVALHSDDVAVDFASFSLNIYHRVSTTFDLRTQIKMGQGPHVFPTDRDPPSPFTFCNRWVLPNFLIITW